MSERPALSGESERSLGFGGEGHSPGFGGGRSASARTARYGETSPKPCEGGPLGLPKAEIVNAMTVDVEDYFHVTALAAAAPRDRWHAFESRVSANTERLLEIFDRAKTRATFFVLGWVAARHPDLVRRIAQAGHEIASHGFHHQLVYDLTPQEFREDIRRTKTLLEELTGTAVDGYRAPSYSITRRSIWALDVLVTEGYRYDASIFPVHHDRYGVPGALRHPHTISCASGRIIEVPPATAQLGQVNLPIAGGGYFRLLPYRWTAWGIRRVNQRERRASTFYLHPWELDPEQPRLPARPFARFRHYHHLDKTESRLHRLLREFRFGSVRDLLGAVDRLEVVAPPAAAAVPS